MFSRSPKKNAQNLEAILTYDENTDSIYLQTKDKSYPSAKIRLEQKDVRAEMDLRDLLDRKGVVPAQRFSSVTLPLPYPEYSSRETTWDRFPLGVHSNGEEAFWETYTAPNALIIGEIGSGKSVIIRSILAHCFHNRNHWQVLGIDLLRVEFASYKRHYPDLLDFASTIPDGVEMLRYAHEEMITRYEKMEEEQVNHFLELNQQPKSLMIIVDEARFLTPVEGVRAHDAIEEEAFKKEMIELLTNMSRLGRAAGINLVITSSRLDAEVLGGELISNCYIRIATGRLDLVQSEALLGNDEATRINYTVKGRGYLQVQGKGADFQGYSPEWKI
jgi:DNA segregation ATPase FtsK/SpoIIIE-like protein